MNYFKSLTKEEKKNIKEEFTKSEEYIIYKKIHKIFILSIIGIILAIVSIGFDLIYKTGVINYVLDGLLFVFSVLFLLKTRSMKLNELNKFALAKKEPTKKEEKKSNKKTTKK